METVAQTLDIRSVEQFLFREAALLDDKRFQEWNELFTEDGDYWIPASINQPDPLDHVSLVYEDRLLRLVRIRRFEDPNAFSLQPIPQSSHLVSNICLDGFDGERQVHVVTSRFVVTEFRRDRQTLFTGRYTHWLKPSPSGLKIQRKRVDLVDCEGARGDISIYL